MNFREKKLKFILNYGIEVFIEVSWVCARKQLTTLSSETWGGKTNFPLDHEGDNYSLLDSLPKIVIVWTRLLSRLFNKRVVKLIRWPNEPTRGTVSRWLVSPLPRDLSRHFWRPPSVRVLGLSLLTNRLLFLGSNKIIPIHSPSSTRLWKGQSHLR